MAPLKRSGRFVNYSTTGEEAAPRWHVEGVRGRAGAGVNKPFISVRLSESKRESQFLLSAPSGTMDLSRLPRLLTTLGTENLVLL